MKQKIKFYFLWLSLICIAVFVLQNLPGIPGFTETFILNSKAIDNFQIWRFFSAIFLHGSVVHLLYNLFALLFFGVVLEKLIGSRNFLIVFLGSGILANIVSVNFYESSLGASGAIYGILGCLTIINPFMMVWAFGLLMPMFVAALLWVAGDIMRISGFFDPGNIGSIAHLSGIFVGLIFGLVLRVFMVKRKEIVDRVIIPDYYIDDWEKKYMGNRN